MYGLGVYGLLLQFSAILNMTKQDKLENQMEEISDFGVNLSNLRNQIHGGHEYLSTKEKKDIFKHMAAIHQILNEKYQEIFEEWLRTEKNG